MKLKLLFILGVPRSGTTLLRVILGSHSQVASSPETPWITGAYGRTSVRALIDGLTTDLTGPGQNLAGVDRAVIVDGARQLIETIFMRYQRVKNKTWLILKTPDDIASVSFLAELFPAAHIAHIVRDGRDVACSSVSESTRGWGTELNGGYGPITIENAMRRWADSETLAASAFAKYCRGRITRIRYEDLVRQPTIALQSLTSALGLGYEPQMLRYSQHSHVLPIWEAGSADVVAQRSITDKSVGRWRREIEKKQALLIWERYSSVLQTRDYTEF